MTNWSLYGKLLDVGESSREASVIKARKDFIADAPYNPAWMIATVNSESIGMLVKASDELHQKWFNAEYDANVTIGDIVELNGISYICSEISNTDDVTLKGHLYECNLYLKFQIGTDSTIYERWCYFDKGVYSTTSTYTSTMETGDQQFRVLISYDDYTKKIQRDKRLATEILYMPDGTTQLRCYRVTSNDSLGMSFGDGSILELKVREDEYDPNTDSIENMICDYQSTTTTPPSDGGGWVDA